MTDDTTQPRRAFLNRVRSLHNIDRDQLPELTTGEWARFRDDPVSYFMRTDDFAAAAIWREVEKRQAIGSNASCSAKDHGLLVAAVAARDWILSLPRDIKMAPYDRRAGAAAYTAIDAAINKTKEAREAEK